MQFETFGTGVTGFVNFADTKKGEDTENRGKFFTDLALLMAKHHVIKVDVCITPVYEGKEEIEGCQGRA